MAQSRGEERKAKPIVANPRREILVTNEMNPKYLVRAVKAKRKTQGLNPELPKAQKGTRAQLESTMIIGLSFS